MENPSQYKYKYIYNFCCQIRTLVKLLSLVLAYDTLEMNLADIQLSIRRNADEYQDYVKDLGGWLETGAKQRQPQTEKKVVTPEDRDEAFIAKEKGNLVFKKGQYAKAISLYSEALQRDPYDPVYYVNRAMAHLKLEQYAEAKNDCDRCLEIDQKNVKALFRRALALTNLNKTDAAIEDLKLLLVLEPGNKSIQDEIKSLESKIKDQCIEPAELEPEQQEVWSCDLDIAHVNEPKKFYKS